MIPTCILVAVLAQAEPAAECQRDDNACKARRHERRAEAATTPEDRAYYLHLAHRSYLFSFDRSRDTADLCAARRNFDASLAVEGQSMKQRESTVAVEKDLQAREGAAHTSCRRQDRKSQRARTSEPPTRIAAASPDELRSDLPVHAQAVGTNVTPGDLDELRWDPLRAQAVEKAQGDSAAPLAELAATQAPAIPTHLVSTDALMPVPSRRASPRSGRGLVIAGGASLGVGLALAGVAGYLGGRTLDARRQAAALGGTVDGYADDAQLAQDQQLTRDYEQRGTQTLALALVGGTTIVVAAVLLGVGGRRMARVATRTSLAPVPGGLVFSARF
jgi:hypothetical protein